MYIRGGMNNFMLKKFFEIKKKILEPVSKAMSSIVNFVLLSVVYFAGVGLVSMVMKLFGKRFLDLKKTNNKSSWHEHKTAKQPIEKYYRTF